MLFKGAWDVHKTFVPQRNRWCWISPLIIFSKLWQSKILWFLFAGFKSIILCLFTCYDLWNTHFLPKYRSWKLQLESWNLNHEQLNWTLILWNAAADIAFRGVLVRSIEPFWKKEIGFPKQTVMLFFDQFDHRHSLDWFETEKILKSAKTSRKGHNRHCWSSQKTFMLTDFF